MKVFIAAIYFFFTANPTNFGLHEQLQNKWKSQIADETHGEFESTYASSFVGHGADAMPNVRLVNNACCTHSKQSVLGVVKESLCPLIVCLDVLLVQLFLNG